MLPGPTAPCSLAGLLAEFRPCFTAPTFQTFLGLVVGLIAQTRRRTVCGMLTGTGLNQVWHHSRAHRLFTNARWSGDALGLALADLIVARLLPADSAVTIAVDDTLFKRSGKKVFGATWHHDGAAKGPKPIGFGNCWVVAGIVVPRPPPDHRTAAPGRRAARVCAAFQRAPTSPITRSTPTRGWQSATFRHSRPAATTRPARRHHPRIRAGSMR
jgi:DDE superfamily endonuclease